MVGQIQDQDSENQPTWDETVPEWLNFSDEESCRGLEEPSPDDVKTTTMVVDSRIQMFRDFCHRSLYFQVDTPSGRPMKALLIPLIEKNIVSSDWIAREGVDSIECSEINIEAPWFCDYKSSLATTVTLKAGPEPIETLAYVVPHFQDGVDIVFGRQFWVENIPDRCNVQNLTRVYFEFSYSSEKSLNIKGLPLEEEPFSLPLKLPELL